MANADRPNGAEPQGKVLRATNYVAGAICYPGDLVQLSSDGKVDPATSDSVCLGVALTYASADGEAVLVADDPAQKFVIQADGSDVDAQTDVGLNYSIVPTAGNSTYRVSRMELDSSTGDAVASTSASLPLQLLGIVPQSNNALGANVKCVVRINNHQLAAGRAGV